MIERIMKKKVAVLGFAYNFPSRSNNSFVDSLFDGEDLVSSVDETRWAQSCYQHPDRAHPGTSYTFAAGSIGDVSGFDASFFRISPREGALMDPQQRKLLEWSWEAFENAGIRPSSIRGTNCGVYIGIASADYSYRLADDLAAVDSFVATGNTASIAANRLSYFFDLRGPSMAIDTACSSSLVAFHQACQSILSGENRMALAGGVSLHLHPYGFVIFSKASMLSRKGRCNVFDADGDGYVRSEGGGIFILKDYDAAVADGDNILAVVAGTAVNTDGRKTGLTVPSDQAQADLLRRAYANADISPDEIDYLEAHGTGTAVGDPIETRAIGKALGQSRKHKLPIGSVKSNVGHLEAASGVAGLAKALYAIKYRKVPATIGIKTFNPKINFSDLNLEVVTQNKPLKMSGKLTVGVNSFGFGGANAHVILQSHDAVVDGIAVIAKQQLMPIVLSATSDHALAESARQLSEFVADTKPDFYDLTYTLSKRRDWHEHRVVAYCSSVEEVQKQFAEFAAEISSDLAISSGTALPKAKGPAFVYSGNGSQWFGMGQVLLQESPIFRSAIEEVDSYFLPLGGFSLVDELSGINGEDRYAFTEIAQPALFAIQVGITCMLRSMGIEPIATMGHSVGEIAAAWCSGALSLADATHLIYHRSHLQGLTKGQGKMAAVGLGEEEALARITALQLNGRLCITGVNSSRGVTVAGSVADLAVMERSVVADGKFYRLLDLDYAFHSPAMDAIEDQVVAALSILKPQTSSIPFYSTVTGKLCEGTLLNSDYWWHNVREPVLFEAAAKSIVADGINLFVEIGPHTVLRSYLADSLKDISVDGRIVPTLTRGDERAEKISQAAQRLLVAGAEISESSIFPVEGRFVSLPNYPWQREKLWHPVTSESVGLLARKPLHPLLGYALKQHAQIWENPLDTAVLPMLADHVVGDAMVFPGTGYVEIALAAAKACSPCDALEIEELEILSPLIFNEGQSSLVRTRIAASDGELCIEARDYAGQGAWTLHAKARIRPEPSTLRLQLDRLNIPLVQPNFTQASHQALTRQVGLDYGPAFRCVQYGWADGEHVLAQLQIPDGISLALGDYLLHPAILDCTFQLIIQLIRDEVAAIAGIAFVPTRISHVTCRTTAGTPAYARASLLQRSPHSLTARFVIFDQSGDVLAVIEEARFRSVRLFKQSAEAILPLDYRCEPAPLPHLSSNSLGAQQVIAALQSLLCKLQESINGPDFAGEVDPLLDSLAIHYTQETLQACSELGALTESRAFTDAEAQSRYRACLELAAADQTLVRTESGWTLDPQAISEAKAQDIWSLMAAEYPEYFQLVHAISLGSRMTQELLLELPAPLRVAAPSFDVLWAAAIGADRQSEVVGCLAEMLRCHMTVLPAGQRFAVLELGAGAPLWAQAAMQALDFSRGRYTFAADSAERLAELEHWQEQHPSLYLVQRGMPIPACHLALVNLDYLSVVDARQAVEYAQSCLLPDGVLLLVGRHRSRWLENIYPTRYKQPVNVAQHWQTSLAQQGWQVSTLLEAAPDTLTDLFFLTASRTVVTSQDSETVLPVQHILLLADTLPEGWVEAMQQALRAEGISAQVQMQINSADTVAVSLAERTDLTAWQHIVYLQGLFASPATPLERVVQQTQRCHGVTQLLKTCEQLVPKAALWLVTHGAASSWISGAPTNKQADSALWGFGRTLLNEFADRTVRLLDVACLEDQSLLARCLARELAHPDAEQEIVLDAQGERYVPRMHVSSLAPKTQTQNADRLIRLGFQFPGQLRNLHWESLPVVPLASTQIEVDVRTTGLNFRDVMYALGLLSDEAVENGFAGPSLGLEFAGVVRAVGAEIQAYRPGDLVVGFGPYSFANRVITSESAIAHIPQGISFEAAATIPSVFFTVYYALQHLAQLQAGEKILIHGAAGGVGIAAIQLAKHLGAEIYATAGSPEKRAFLRNMGVEHIFDSRSLDFADEILQQTGGEGVDVVLNSLAGEAVNRNFDVLKPFGRFLELGKRDFYENTKIGLRPFRNNISYFGIDADQLMQVRPALTRRLFGEVMQLFADRTLTPLPYHAFPAEQVVDAFRYMQQARQIGKIVVTYYNDLAALVAPILRNDQALQLQADACYLITGGLGGFGLQTAKWLVEKGARHLVLLSRRGPVDADAKAAIAEMTAQGVQVLARACDVTSLPALEAVFAEIEKSCPPLRGVVHAAVVIDDALIQNISPEQIERVLRPKMLGADYLDALTANLPLDFFILYSSATTLFGNPGQACYVAANSYLESLAAGRRARGLPATCVRWGAIDDVGFLARNTKIKDALQGRMGGQALSSTTALAYLEQMLINDISGIGLMELDWRALARFLPSATSPKFSHLARLSAADRDGEESSMDVQKLLAELDDDALLQTFVSMLKNEVGNILRIPAEKIDASASIYDMGLDSLMGVELVMALEERFGTRLPVMALSESPNVNKLAERLIVILRGQTEQPTQDDAALAQLQQIAAQHGVSVDAQAEAHALNMARTNDSSTSRIIH